MNANIAAVRHEFRAAAVLLVLSNAAAAAGMSSYPVLQAAPLLVRVYCPLVVCTSQLRQAGL
jgi:hypothetical protein